MVYNDQTRWSRTLINEIQLIVGVKIHDFFFKNKINIVRTSLTQMVPNGILANFQFLSNCITVHMPVQHHVYIILSTFSMIGLPEPVLS
uniref:Uncharacterized protein n=1 Tax=Lepeophtheirus salmonis TaxID=72036 RepID=A0A0K2V314_LEPSM